MKEALGEGGGGGGGGGCQNQPPYLLIFKMWTNLNH